MIQYLTQVEGAIRINIPSYLAKKSKDKIYTVNNTETFPIDLCIYFISRVGAGSF